MCREISWSSRSNGPSKFSRCTRKPPPPDRSAEPGMRPWSGNSVFCSAPRDTVRVTTPTACGPAPSHRRSPQDQQALQLSPRVRSDLDRPPYHGRQPPAGREFDRIDPDGSQKQQFRVQPAYAFESTRRIVCLYTHDALERTANIADVGGTLAEYDYVGGRIARRATSSATSTTTRK